jgi:hypothetical protein
LARGDRINGTDCGHAYRRSQKIHLLNILLSKGNIKAKYWITIVIYGREKGAEFL